MDPLPMIHRPLLLLIAGLWALAPATEAEAQLPRYPDGGDRVRDEALVAVGNVALGGLTAGVRQWRAGGSFTDGRWRGALGGGTTWIGKRIAVTEGTEAGVLGRTVAAVGTSMTRNASEGVGSLAHLVIPVGPARLRWDREEESLDWSVDAVATGAMLWARFSGQGARLDWGHSLRTGAPVYVARRWRHDWGWSGRHAFGTIMIGEPFRETLNVLAHERVHVIQNDQAYLLWAEPLEKRLLAWIGVPERIASRVDLSLHVPFWAYLDTRVMPDRNPWEFEADVLADTRE